MLIFIPTCIGVIGYMLIEKYTFIEAFYMTVITVATVGFGEVKPLSDVGRIFTSLLIILNLGTFAYAISIVTGILTQSDFFERYNISKMKNKIASLRNHVIVCGFGRNGKEACIMLKRSKIKYVVIESKKEMTDEFAAQDEFYFLNEDATHEQTLIDAGIRHARGIITTLPDDANNVYVTLTARELNDNVVIVSRASKDSSVTKLKRAGADNVIMPDKIGGAHMASLIVHPDVKEFIDLLSVQTDSEVRLDQISMKKIRSKFKGNNIDELGIREKTGVTVIGLKNADGTFTVNPDLKQPLEENSKLFLLGSRAQMDKLKEMF
ncbi:MAG: potassium channel family protein [Bacteroidia bacterium]